jgi:hypothetical protein
MHTSKPSRVTVVFRRFISSSNSLFEKSFLIYMWLVPAGIFSLCLSSGVMHPLTLPWRTCFLVISLCWSRVLSRCCMFFLVFSRFFAETYQIAYEKQDFQTIKLYETAKSRSALLCCVIGKLSVLACNSKILKL